MEYTKPGSYEFIEDYYAGKSVFVTGGTGFLGKVLMEKLVYSCPSITNVYVLVRDKKNVTAEERITRLLDSKLFTRVRNERPKDLKKIVPIVGDITMEDLGLTNLDRTLLLEKVSVVFHLAATIRFNEPLSEAMRINVEGTRIVMQFAKQIKNLKCFLYMSTAFSQTDQAILEEIVYPAPMKIDDVYEFLKKYGDDEMRVQEILKDRPNTYTFTKAITESLVNETRGDLPVVVIRPSVVVAAMEEPIPGWMDAWIGPTPVLDLIARGWLQGFYGKPDYAFDIIPVDYVINATIVAAARCQRSKRLPIYNCCTSTINKLTLKAMYSFYTGESIRRGYNEITIKSMIFTKYLWILYLIRLVSLIIPAYLRDFILFLKRKPTRYITMQRKIGSYLEIVRFFSSRSWVMMSTRLRDLAEDLHKEDQLKFPCHPADICWASFMPIYFNGVVKFLGAK